MKIELNVIEWPDDRDLGPRLLGRLQDSDLVRQAVERLHDSRERELKELERNLRLVHSKDSQ